MILKTIEKEIFEIVYQGMTEQEGKNLLAKYDQGLCNADEKALIESWYLNVSSKAPQMDGDIDYAYWHSRIKGNLPIKHTGVFKLWPRIAAAACMILVIGVFFYTNQFKNDNVPRNAYANDVAPGLTGATLTLANGKQIKLANAANGEIASEAGISVTKTGDGQLIYSVENAYSALEHEQQTNILSTTRGETYQVKLPDGTSIWLNAASSLKYPANFSILKTRTVQLQGEAYFEVAKDESRPFIIETNLQKVTVLGTHFNINAYADEVRTKTTLLEGSVKVDLFSKGRSPEREVNNTKKPLSLKGSLPEGERSVTLKPNQQAVFLPPSELNGVAREGKLDVVTANIEEAIAWKNGNFIFNGEDIESIMRKLIRWYNIKVEYEGVVTSEQYYGNISRFKNISEVLSMLEKAQGVHFKIEGNKVIVVR